MGGQRRWTRLVDVGQRRGKRAAPGLLQKLRRPSTNGCPFYGVLGPGADHERNQLKRRVDDLEKKIAKRLKEEESERPYLACV